MKGIERYYQLLLGQFDAIRHSQWANIEQAGKLLGESLIKGGWLYAFGTGHSHAIAEEIFYRAGNLARATPILDDTLMLHKEAIEATYKEREPGYGRDLLKRYPVKAGDVLVVISNSGRNAVPIDIALQGTELGMKVIAITNLTQSLAWPSRHISGKRLADAAHLTIDNCGVDGDSALEMEGLPGRIGPTTTSTGALIMNCIIVEGIEYALKAGHPPEIFISSNTNGDDHNDLLLQKYKHLNPHL